MSYYYNGQVVDTSSLYGTYTNLTNANGEQLVPLTFGGAPHATSGVNLVPNSPGYGTYVQGTGNYLKYPAAQPAPASVTTFNPPAGPVYYPSAPVYNPPPPPPPPPPARTSTPAPTTRSPTPAPTPAPTTRAPTPVPTQAPTSAAPITPAPTTRAPTPSPTPAPMPPPSYLRYPSNLVVLVHEGEWMNTGILKVLTLRGSTPSLQPFVYKDLTQVFAIDSRGAMRCVADQGTYVNPASTCDGVVGGSNASEWRFVDRDLPRSYSVEVKCAIGTRRIEFNSMVHPSAILLGGTAGSSVGWFVVPVARTGPAETTPSIGQTGRTEWPELLGTNAETARRGLAAARPDLMVSVIGTNSVVTMDWRENRVRIRAGANGMVESVPRIG